MDVDVDPLLPVLVMYADEYPDLAQSDLNGPCPAGGWPTFGFHAVTHGYETAEHIGPISVKWVSQGTETYVVNGVPINVTPERMLVLADGQSYQSTVEDGSETHSLCAFFAPAFVTQVVPTAQHAIEEVLDDPARGHDRPFEVMPQAIDAHGSLAEKMIHLRSAVDAGAEHLDMEQRLSDVLLEVFHLQQRTAVSIERVPAQKRSTRQEVYRRLLLSMAFMDGNCTRSLSLAEIAAVAWMSPYHFVRMFREVMGMTPFQYICSRRIERAKSLLRLADDPIVEVAEAVGYESHTSFHAAFRRWTGETPTVYRRRRIRNLEERLRP